MLRDVHAIVMMCHDGMTVATAEPGADYCNLVNCFRVTIFIHATNKFFNTEAATSGRVLSRVLVPVTCLRAVAMTCRLLLHLGHLFSKSVNDIKRKQQLSPYQHMTKPEGYYTTIPTK